MMSGKHFWKNTGSSSLSSSPPSSSRRSKRGSQDKPKQPQRGLGVEQLEKIRLHEEMGCSFNHPASNNFSHVADPRVLTAYSSPTVPSSLSQPISVSPSSYSFQQSFTTGLNEYGTTNILYADAQPAPITSHNLDLSENFPFSQSYTENRQFLNPDQEDSWQMRNTTRMIRSDGRNSSEFSDDNQEVDLELRLSL